MLEDRDSKIDGDLEIARDTRLYGMVTGNVTVMPGRTLVVHGMIGGTLLVEPTATVHVYGTVFGDVVNRDGELHVWSTGILRGHLERGTGTTIEPGARVRGLVPVAVSGTGELQGLRVLVVEDDDATRDEIVALLQSCSAQPIAARNGSDGYDTFRRERPDAIVADIWMPTSDGYDLVKRVRAHSFEEGGLTPAIAMTASSVDTQEKALLAGFHAYLQKPFDPEAFIDLISSFHQAMKASGAEEPAARWTVAKPRAGHLVLTFSDYVRPIDMRDGVGAVVLHLAQAPATVMVDARHVTGFDISVGYIAERTVWAQRRRVEKVVLVSSDQGVRLVCAAACAILGIPYEALDEPPQEEVASSQ